LLTSILTVVCFTVIVAGNLSAVAWILSVVSGWTYLTSLILATTIILLYTMAGGLYAAIWTDFFQIHIAFIGFIGAAIYLLWTRDWSTFTTAVPTQTWDTAQILTLKGGGLANWAGLISLAFGNAMALDFMERV